MPPSISVCIPVWNGRNWLGGAIEHLLAQTYPSWELVIGDNASTDDTAEIAARYPDSRIRYQCWPTHTDIIENFNRTMGLCRYQWIQPLGVDDRLDPHCLEAIACRIEQTAPTTARLALVLTACRHILTNGRPAERELFQHGQPIRITDGLYNGEAWLKLHARASPWPWAIGSVAFAHDVLAESGAFRSEAGFAADAELVLRMAAYGDVAYIDEPLLNYMVRSDSASSSQLRQTLQQSNSLAPLSMAWLMALWAHQTRRSVSASERALVAEAIARALLQRALQHRRHPLGRGRRGAIADVARAVSYDPAGVLLSWRVGELLGVLLAPRGTLDWVSATIAERRWGRAEADARATS